MLDQFKNNNKKTCENTFKSTFFQSIHSWAYFFSRGLTVVALSVCLLIGLFVRLSVCRYEEKEKKKKTCFEASLCRHIVT